MKINVKALAEKLTENAKLIKTTSARWATLTITSHDSVCSVIIEPQTRTATTPAIEMDINSSGGITVFSDTGGGWQMKRTI